MLLEFCRLEFWETAFPFKAPQWRMQERCEWFLVSNSCRGISLILFKGGLSRPLFRLFWVFFKQAIHFRYNISWSCLSSIRCKDSNPRSLEHESCHNHWTRVPAHRFHSSFILVSEKWIFTFLQKLLEWWFQFWIMWIINGPSPAFCLFSVFSNKQYHFTANSLIGYLKVSRVN